MLFWPHFVFFYGIFWDCHFTSLWPFWGHVTEIFFSAGALTRHWGLKIEKMRRLGHSTHLTEQSFCINIGAQTTAIHREIEPKNCFRKKLRKFTKMSIRNFGKSALKSCPWAEKKKKISKNVFFALTNHTNTLDHMGTVITVI